MQSQNKTRSCAIAARPNAAIPLTHRSHAPAWERIQGRSRVPISSVRRSLYFSPCTTFKSSPSPSGRGEKAQHLRITEAMKCCRTGTPRGVDGGHNPAPQGPVEKAVEMLLIHSEKGVEKLRIGCGKAAGALGESCGKAVQQLEEKVLG